MTTWPSVDHDEPVSTVVSPVTHTADVAVNSASSTPAPSGVALAAGSASSPVPTRIPAANASAMTWAGLPVRPPLPDPPDPRRLTRGPG
ncbi:hypothetical protein GCM10023200_15580 [Actinomycetospora chlora]|uniref:Uncharacterized protein n=1 Tax=Actinomycetospora chlora TaxID=663608 RepID=A0ABP9AL74_9PSEU